jgi:hypothetical protein
MITHAGFSLACIEIAQAIEIAQVETLYCSI